MRRALAIRWHEAQQRFAQRLRRYGKRLDSYANGRLLFWRSQR